MENTRTIDKTKVQVDEICKVVEELRKENQQLRDRKTELEEMIDSTNAAVLQRPSKIAPDRQR